MSRTTGFIEVDGALPWIPKDPLAKLPYTLDWLAKGWLADGNTISDATFDAEDGITVEPESDWDATTTTVWLSGGEPDVSYTVRTNILTAAGHRDVRSFQVCVQAR